MNILLIDNGTIRLSELKSLLRGNRVKIIKFDKIKSITIKDFNLIILSGSSSHLPILGNQSLYKDEIWLIRNAAVPIIGICFGFELIGYAYGAELKELKTREKGIIKIQVTNPDSIFHNLPNFDVYESHRWVIKKLPKDLIELARSKDGIEAIKHKTKKIYGFQFHPEMFTERTCGDEIFRNLLNSLK